MQCRRTIAGSSLQPFARGVRPIFVLTEWLIPKFDEFGRRSLAQGRELANRPLLAHKYGLAKLLSVCRKTTRRGKPASRRRE